MSHNYTVDVAGYDGSSTDSNPWVWIHGTVDGQSAGYRPIYWAAIQQAFAVAGQAGVQQLLAPILLSCVTGPPFPTIPTFQSSNIPAPNMGNAAFKNSTCTQALVPQWTQ